MKSITKRALCIALILVSLFTLASCAMRFNDVHTPYDDISNLGKFVRLAKYETEVKNSDVKDMMDAEVKAFIRSYATELLVGDKLNGTADRAIKKGDDVTVNTTIKVYDKNGELKDFDDLLDIKEGDTTTTANLSNYTIEDVGNGNFLPEIENALLDDCWTGDYKYVDVQYDDKVQTAELKNQKVQIDKHGGEIFHLREFRMKCSLIQAANAAKGILNGTGHPGQLVSLHLAHADQSVAICSRLAKGKALGFLSLRELHQSLMFKIPGRNGQGLHSRGNFAGFRSSQPIHGRPGRIPVSKIPKALFQEAASYRRKYRRMSGYAFFRLRPI